MSVNPTFIRELKAYNRGIAAGIGGDINPVTEDSMEDNVIFRIGLSLGQLNRELIALQNRVNHLEQSQWTPMRVIRPEDL